MNAKRLSIFGNFFFVSVIVFGTAIVSVLFVKSDLSIILQLLVISYFSFLPAWIYIQFISTKGKTLWDEYVLNLFRLSIDHYAYLPKPPKYSLYYYAWKDSHDSVSHLYDSETSPADKEVDAFNNLYGREAYEDNIYQKKFESLYGTNLKFIGNGFKKAISFKGENLYFMGPVMVATFIITICWAIVIEPVGIFGYNLLGVEAGSTGDAFTQFPFSTLKFGVLGAYFYVLQMLIRRFFQHDLRRNAYVSVIMRYIVVILLVWVMDIVLGESVDESQRNALAFIVGVFPHIGWKVIVALIKLPIKSIVPSLQQEYPLSDLDGLNIWYESRLLEEGIEDMQNLATANLVDIMLNTRIPVERLVDWVDQSILYLHLGKSKNAEGIEHKEVLRKFGVRGATDLDDIFFADDKELNNKLTHNKISDTILARIKKDPLINILNAEGDKSTPVLLSVLKALKRSPNLYHIRQWKRYSQDQSALFSQIKDNQKQRIKDVREGALKNMMTEVLYELSNFEKDHKIDPSLKERILNPIKSSLNSVRTKASTSIKFFNNTNEQLEICWVNEQQEIPYYQLPPGATYVLQTYVGQHWDVRYADEDVSFYTAQAEVAPLKLRFDPEGIIFKNNSKLVKKGGTLPNKDLIPDLS